MRRREFITLVGGAAAWPLAARAQLGGPMPRVGELTVALSTSPIEGAFRQGLRDLGYVEGQNLAIDFKTAEFKTELLDRLAAELIASKADVIFSSGSEATTAVRSLTTSIPIVMTSSNPVGLGFVTSLARPGGNVTGLSIFGPDVAGKRLETLKTLVPGLAKAAAFWNPNDPGARFSLKETEAAGAALNVALTSIEVRTVDGFEDAFHAATAAHADAVVVLPAPLMSRNSERLAGLAIQNRLPAIFYDREAVKAGGLISYGANIAGVYHRAAYFVDRILKGAKPADLPVEQPTKFELFINMTTAKALGVTVPPTILAIADEVIE
jgi:putative tryptophan/tyrosine transport system substrate-binding protein